MEYILYKERYQSSYLIKSSFLSSVIVLIIVFFFFYADEITEFRLPTHYMVQILLLRLQIFALFLLKVVLFPFVYGVYRLCGLCKIVHPRLVT